MRTARIFRVALALWTLGCGTSGDIAKSDSGPRDASVAEVGVDASRVWCAECCGPIDSGVDEGHGPPTLCTPGQICGQHTTLAGYYCCTPDAAPDAEIDPFCYP